MNWNVEKLKNKDFLNFKTTNGFFNPKQQLCRIILEATLRSLLNYEINLLNVTFEWLQTLHLEFVV